MDNHAGVDSELDVDFELLDQQLAALIGDEPDVLANTANFVGLLYEAMPSVNWLGVYVLRDDCLVLGPFQGKPACVRIPLGQGVCGAAAKRLETLRVADVHDFAGHIACDPDSRSELVVPLKIDGTLVGVLDVDSPQLNRFSERDQAGVEGLCRKFTDALQQKGPGATGRFI